MHALQRLAREIEIGKMLRNCVQVAPLRDVIATRSCLFVFSPRSETNLTTWALLHWEMSEVTVRHPLETSEESRMICAQVVHALAHCHACGIAHSNVRPSKILVDYASVNYCFKLLIRLSDFGDAVPLLSRVGIWMTNIRALFRMRE